MSHRYGKRGEPYNPGENLPDLTQVPEKTLAILTENPAFNNLPRLLVEPLAGRKERPWFTEHFYFCLPVTFGNQHGFIVRMLYDTVIRWNGTEDVSGVAVFQRRPKGAEEHQKVESHFGSGILTIQNRWVFRTPPGVNLLVGGPPNFLLEGITPMTAVVETDQLRRDFTFNLKVNIQHRDILIPRGAPIGWVMPYPRHFLDHYRLELYPDGEALENERRTIYHYGVSRRDYENGVPGHLYRRGVDIYGNKFQEHQRNLPGQERREWKQGMELAPLGPVQEIENLSTTEPDDELLADERELLLSILKDLQKLNPNSRLAHVTSTYHYIQYLRTQDTSDDEIRKTLREAGWSDDALNLFFTRV